MREVTGCYQAVKTAVNHTSLPNVLSERIERERKKIESEQKEKIN